MKFPWATVGKIAVAVITLCLGASLSFYGLFRIIRGKPNESVTQVENGPFKILVRSQEFRHSGTVNIDICVAEISSSKFPGRGQCFFHGFDLDGLSAEWRGQHEIEISLADGYVTEFRNYASAVDRKSSLPVQFHITMRDEHCDPYPKYPGGNPLKPCPSLKLN
jgi:hypothetical protein